MLDGLSALVDLSRLDADLGGLEAERAEIPGKQAACAEEREKARERLVSAREAVTEAEQAQRRAESEAQDQEALLARLEGQQHQVKSNEAYTALLTEMEQAKAAISDAETRVLEAMEGIEETKASLASLEAQVGAATDRIDAQESELAKRADGLAEEIEALRTRRDTQKASIDGDLVRRYEKILSRRSPAVALVARETCLGCRVGIPPQAAIELLRGEAIVTCGICQRILIRQELAEGRE